jgi:phage/conjugal plasmid C-4 type zinc finger TraR family protein
MADEIDNAQAYDEFFLNLALKNRNGSRGSRGEDNLSTSGLDPRSSNLYCIDCEEEIPEARRRAVPGCRRCVDCQSLHENWRPV